MQYKELIKMRVLLLPIILIFLVGCRSKSEKSLIGKWKMIKSEFKCQNSVQEKLLNSFSTAKNIIYQFNDSSFQTFYNQETPPLVPYKFENDTLLISYPREDPPFISKSFINFSSKDKFIMREERKEVNCILVSTFERMK